jgi:hypothetical protein
MRPGQVTQWDAGIKLQFRIHHKTSAGFDKRVCRITSRKVVLMVALV